MTPELWQKVKRIFDSLLDLDPGRRPGFLEEACGGDPALRQEVESLIASHEKAGDFLDRPVLTAAADLAPEEPGALPGGVMIGPYRIEGTLGRGGQATVYLAEDTRLSRKVALKVLWSSMTPSRAPLLRFEREARAISRLDHPGICTLYEAGEHRGISYIAMRYVEGESLAGRIASKKGEDRTGGPPVPSEEIFRIVRLFEGAAQALHAAHEAGLIHRDIKPSNILVSREGEPVILDFGLARDEDGDLEPVTGTDEVLGTLAYMSPEQVLSRKARLDRRTDVYSLGVSLYECLTFQKPFEAPSKAELFQKILKGDPPDPRRLNRHISKDLKVVLETALEKDRDRRYKTALDLAEDLRRVREREPIRARPAGPLLRLIRWGQRNPALAASLAGLLLSLAVALGITAFFLGKTERALREKEEALAESQEAYAQSREAHSKTLEERAAKERALEEKRKALEEMGKAFDAREKVLIKAEGLRLVDHAKSLISTDPGLALLLAVEGAQRAPGLITNNTLLGALDACHEERTLFHGDHHVHHAAFSPDGMRLVTAADQEATIWDLETGKQISMLRGHRGSVTSVSFSPDGLRIGSASEDKTARIWDAGTGMELLVLAGHENQLRCAAFSPDGRRVVTASDDRTARIWDARSGKQLAVLKGRLEPVPSAAFSPDGKKILTWEVGTTARIWDAETGEELIIFKHESWISCAAFSPDGQRILTAEDKNVRIWDALTGKQLAVLKGHGGPIKSAAFRPDDKRIATAAADGTVRIWNEEGAEIAQISLGKIASDLSATFRPDRERLHRLPEWQGGRTGEGEGPARRASGLRLRGGTGPSRPPRSGSILDRLRITACRGKRDRPPMRQQRPEHLRIHRGSSPGGGEAQPGRKGSRSPEAFPGYSRTGSCRGPLIVCRGEGPPAGREARGGSPEIW